MGPWSQLTQNFLAERQRQYEETNDFYDLQREEVKDIASVLEGTYGTDNKYLNELVVQARNEYKELLKGLKLKDYNTPAVQDKIFEIKNRLSKAKNVSATSLEQIKQAYALSKTDHMKEGEFNRYLTSQMALPPDQRDPDLLAKVQTDPLFINGYDYLTSVLDARKSTTEPLQRKDANFFYSYEATYRPDLGYFDKSGEWVFDPKPEVIDDALKNPQFYNLILGMMDPDDVQKMTATGNKNELKKAVKEMTKTYMNEVFMREEGGKRVGPYDPQLEQKGRTLNPSKYTRPTTYDKEKNDLNSEVNAIQQRLLSNNAQAFDEYISPDGWRGFALEDSNKDGKIDKIIGTMVDKSHFMYGKLPGTPPMRTEEISVNIDDAGSVQQALSRIKFVLSKDKEDVQAQPLEPQKPVKLKSEYTIKGKKYSIEALKKMGYSEERIMEAVNKGLIK